MMIAKMIWWFLVTCEFPTCQRLGRQSGKEALLGRQSGKEALLPAKGSCLECLLLVSSDTWDRRVTIPSGFKVHTHTLVLQGAHTLVLHLVDCKLI